MHLAIRGFERAPKLLERVVEARAHRAYWCPNRRGDLVDGEVAVEPEDDGDALICIEAAERAVECIAIVDLAMGVMRGRRRSCSIQAVVSSVASTSEAISTRIDEDPAEPGVEALGIAEPSVIPPSSDESVVGRILSLLCVAEDETSEPIGCVEAIVDKPFECSGPGRLGVRRDDVGLFAQTGPLSFRNVFRFC